MLNAIIDFSLRHRFLVIVSALTFAAIGGVSLRHLDIDAFPDSGQLLTNDLGDFISLQISCHNTSC